VTSFHFKGSLVAEVASQMCHSSHQNLFTSDVTKVSRLSALVHTTLWDKIQSSYICKYMYQLSSVLKQFT